jgi:type II secretory ATPase GspE/PulE/Tfp pilus assembly ATPase PilB-like protein
MNALIRGDIAIEEHGPDLAAIRRDFPIVESAEGGRHPARGKVVDWLCYRENITREHGVLLISSDHIALDQVWDYQNYLETLGKKFRTHHVSAKAISTLNQDAADKATLPDADEQAHVLQILQEGARRKASDVHIQVRDRHTVVRFRVNGRMQTFWDSRTRTEGEAWIKSMYETMAEERSDPTFNDRKDSKAILREEFARKVGLTGARIQNRPAKGWMFTVLRLMHEEASSETIESVGFLPDMHMPLLKYLLACTHGVIIVSGATGHGKSKTLKTFVERYAAKRRQEINFITIEDPTEYPIEGVSVVQTPLLYNTEEPGADAKAWGLAIKSLLRLDPDAIMPGELRDLYSAIGAIEAALTGHLVLTTLHVYDATTTLQRLRGMGVAADVLFNPSNFVGLINQSLVAKLCPACSVPLSAVLRRDGTAPEAAIDPDILERLKRMEPDLSRVRLRSFNGEYCEQCGGIGENARRLIAEICVPNARFMDIYEHKGPMYARKYWVEQMHGFTKCMHVLRLIREGIVDPTTAEEIVGPLDQDLRELGDGVIPVADGQGVARAVEQAAHA